MSLTVYVSYEDVGEQYTVGVVPSGTIRDLRDAVRCESGIDDFTLKLGGEVLSDFDAKLSVVGVIEGDVLILEATPEQEAIIHLERAMVDIEMDAQELMAVMRHFGEYKVIKAMLLKGVPRTHNSVSILGYALTLNRFDVAASLAADFDFTAEANSIFKSSLRRDWHGNPPKYPILTWIIDHFNVLNTPDIVLEAMKLALQQTDPNLLRYLTRHKISPEPWHFTCATTFEHVKILLTLDGAYKCAKTLLFQVCSVSYQFFWTSRAQQHDQIWYLLNEANIDPSVVTTRGVHSESVLNVYVQGMPYAEGMEDIMTALVKRGAPINNIGANIYCSAVDVKVAKVLHDLGAEPNFGVGSPLVHAATNMDLFKFYLKIGCDPITPKSLFTAFPYDMMVEGTQLLLHAGRRPCHEAGSPLRHPDTVEMLIEAGADPRWEDDEEMTPLHYALQEGEMELAGELMKNGGWSEKMNDIADFRYTDFAHTTPGFSAEQVLGGRNLWMAAVKSDSVGLVESLIEKNEAVEVEEEIIEQCRSVEVLNVLTPVYCRNIEGSDVEKCNAVLRTLAASCTATKEMHTHIVDMFKTPEIYSETMLGVTTKPHILQPMLGFVKFDQNGELLHEAAGCYDSITKWRLCDPPNPKTTYATCISAMIEKFGYDEKTLRKTLKTHFTGKRYDVEVVRLLVARGGVDKECVKSLAEGGGDMFGGDREEVWDVVREGKGWKDCDVLFVVKRDDDVKWVLGYPEVRRKIDEGKGGKNSTPLYSALRRNCTYAVGRLIEAGACVSTRHGDGKTLFDVCNLNELGLLLSAGAVPPTTPAPPRIERNEAFWLVRQRNYKLKTFGNPCVTAAVICACTALPDELLSAPQPEEIDYTDIDLF